MDKITLWNYIEVLGGDYEDWNWSRIIKDYKLDEEDIETDYILSRLESYLRFYEEVSKNEHWQKKY